MSLHDLATKLRMLRDFLCGAFEDWREHIWSADLDEPYCCDGGSNPYDLCGCGGATVRDIYSPTKAEQSND